MLRPKSSFQKKPPLPLRVVLTVPNVLLISTLLSLMGWLSFQTGRQTMNDLVGQLLGEATSRISDRLDNYLSERAGEREGEGVNKRIQIPSVNQVPSNQTASVRIKPNRERNGQSSPKTILPQQKTNSSFPTSTFKLEDFRISPNCQTLILDSSGQLVAFSPVTQTDGSGYVDSHSRETTSRQQQQVIQLSTEYLVKRFGNLTAINSSENLNFIKNGSRYLLQVRPFENSQGLNWLIVAVVPETDFMDKVNANTRNNMGLVLLALILSIAFLLFISLRIELRLRQFISATEAIAGGDFDSTISGSGVAELEALARAFEGMNRQLKASRKRLGMKI